MIKYFLGFICILFLTNPLTSQQKISLEDIWEEGTFREKRIPGFSFLNDGKHYTRLVDNKIKKYDITTGSEVAILLDGDLLKRGEEEIKLEDYSFNSDESITLIETNVEQIFRRSYTAEYFLLREKNNTPVAIFDKPVMEATLSPDENHIAFAYENNLYVRNIANDDVLQITKDGKKNEIINGITDWVYEEEFAFVKAFAWSPNGDYLAYIKFDESDVAEFTMTNYYDNLYPEYITWKYPKVGEKNAEISVHIYDVKNKSTKEVDLGSLDDMYIPRIKWTKDNNELCIFKMNRHQNHLELFFANAMNGSIRKILDERNQYYIDISDNLTFLNDGNRFIWTSEKSGFNHIYLYDINGNEIKALTSGKYDVTSFYGVDEINETIYYQAADENPMNKNIYSISLDGRSKNKLSLEEGNNNVQFSSTYDYYVLSNSKINQPHNYQVYNRDKKLIRDIEDNAALKKKQQTYGTTDIEFFDFNTTENVQLNGWMLKPANFDASKQYPVFMFLYGGPGSQQVNNTWKGSNYWWFQMLAQNGYIVACVDNRGTGARGEEFKKMTYLQLGHYETIDQIEAAKHLGNLNYVDKERIGIFGWSYGGYMSSLCILKGNDVFKAAIAVAPVTSWKWYDTIYTERYMRTLEENEKGYVDNSPIYFADRLKGNYLLVHGMGDDNVHFQHTAEMAAALIKANKQFDTYYYPNRNHGIYGDNARLHLYTKMTNFLYEKL